MKENPTILVFYLLRDMFRDKMMINQYAESIRTHFEQKNLDVVCFFLPTDETERLECINPKYIDDQNEYEKLKRILADAEKLLDAQKNEE